ncbi:hypothetical protein BSL82_08430 [Tardibacter chloracetimidivorans]|uniref:Uncharacterized protein n=1 Tax=Tardibacter chloracetimidivorans TaxID=1921510 RepID=A0A1L3ZUM3_9SPHN|nr:hypothetical protein [Tardibacter chloracetimidivorans]API59333.1 hypothetical protein BSL82_08430 [Tardibacter chloracetimidivorans]
MARPDELGDLIQHLFALVASRLEDAHLLATEGQGRSGHTADLVQGARCQIRAALTLVDAIEAIQTQR